MEERVLLAEDEERMRSIVRDYFGAHGVTCDLAKDGAEALELLRTQDYDAVLLDVLMPEADGFTVCRAVREHSRVPILFLTALGEERDMLRGYELGADDYITKPFSLAVLLAKTQAVIRRSRGEGGERLTCGAITLEPGRRRCTAAGAEVELSPREYALLLCLMRNKGQVLSREQLLDKVWGIDFDGGERAVDVRIKSLRLRWRLAVPLAVTFFLLWLGTMYMLTAADQEAIKVKRNLAMTQAREMQEEQWGYYQKNLAKGLGPEAADILQQNMSSYGVGWIDGEAVLALVVRDSAGRELRNQIAWGYGHEYGVDMGDRWYLELDSGLDDEGQKALARWIVDHRSGGNWDYALYPTDPDRGGVVDADGTFARVAGLKGEGNSIQVQRIQIIHPDGTAETMVETSTQGENPVTVDLAYFRLKSLLLPDSNANAGAIDMDLRLSNYHASHAVLDAAAVLLVLSGYLSRRVTGPVENLSALAGRGEPCPQDGPIKELNTLAEAVNAGQEQMRGQIRRERAFTRAAAHELKTPLAILRAHAEALQEDIDPAKREEYLDVVLAETDRMAALTAALLDLSRLEQGEALAREPVELSKLVRGVFDRLALPLERKCIGLKLDLDESWTEGDRARLEMAVSNLASNALRHCAPGGTVSVSLTGEEGGVVLTVDNDGEPIPENDLSRIWEPFYRGDASRSRDTGGTGLGLALVKAAVEAHGGNCSASNREEGVCFRVWLPGLQSAQ